MWRKILVGIILSLLFAVPALSFSISPVRFFITGDPAGIETVKINISNTEARDLVFRPVVYGVRQGNGGQPVFEKNIDVAESWVKPEMATLAVASGNKGVMRFEIKIPRGVPPGSHYLGLGVEPVNDAVGNIGVMTRALSLLTIQVSGVAYEVLQVEKFEHIAARVGEPNWLFDLTLTNKGNVEVNATGDAKVLDWRGNEITTQPIFSSARIISGASKMSDFNIDAAGRGFWPGLYQVQVKVGYGITKQNVISLIYVWYLPVWSLVVVGILFLIFIGSVVFLARRYQMKKIMARL